MAVTADQSIIASYHNGIADELESRLERFRPQLHNKLGPMHDCEGNVIVSEYECDVFRMIKAHRILASKAAQQQ